MRLTEHPWILFTICRYPSVPGTVFHTTTTSAVPVWASGGWFTTSVPPLALSDAGELWLILCSIDWAPDDSVLRAAVTSEISSKVWYYDLDTMTWKESPQEILTDLEKAVLILSNRGFTMNEIADAIFKSVDSVKGYRKSLFVKLGVSNITEAIACAKARKLV